MAKKKRSSNRTLLNISVQTLIDDYIYRIDIDADYQREKIWSTKQQELLLDSIVNDIDIPKIYICAAEDDGQFDYECIDGKQRMTALLRFFKPDEGEEPLKLQFLNRRYTYDELLEDYPEIAKRIADYELSFTVYGKLEDEFVRDIFRRLQLGIRLNSGELLKSRTGTIRNFIFKDIGNDGPFFIKSGLSKKRSSRPFTLAQICLNSFAKAQEGGDFVRARLQDIEDFFEDNHDLSTKDSNLKRIKQVLYLMDEAFDQKADIITSRAIAVSGFLFVEELLKNDQQNLAKDFANFYIDLLLEIKENMELLSNYEPPNNSYLMEEFQKYVLQASVEAYSIRRRHLFLKRNFDSYLKSKRLGATKKSTEKRKGKK